MGMIVQTLAVSETRPERSLEKAIAKHFARRDGDARIAERRGTNRAVAGASLAGTRRAR